MTQAKLSGFHHVAINVRDLDAAVRWYGEVLGFRPLIPWDTGTFQRRILRHPGGTVLALSRHDHPDGETRFNERVTGLDHLAFRVDTRAELDAWAARLTVAGIEHSGVCVTPEMGFTLIAFRDPDGIQLELYLAEDAPDR
ncbi:VOC family protein [Longispora albida]|uniref:VOC family protein n=1 Tax=Longispora albida TaxID=203523 RepID=UPI000362D50F|nr:VOC family protein [Longispora albida]